MDAARAAAWRRAKPNRGRPLVPPNYVSLRDLQELRLREKEEQRRREEEEAAARRVREEQRKRQVEEEAAARRIVEERRRREEEAAARRARDAAAVVAAAAPKAEMRASLSTQNSSSSFRYNERARGGQRLVVVADRPPRAAGKIDGTTEGCLGKKWADGGAPNEPLRGGFKAQHVGRGKVSAGVLAGPGEPDKPATASSHAGKPEEKRNGGASGCQGTASGASSASRELAKVDIASCRGPARPRNRHQGKKGFDGRSTETAITRSIGQALEASPLPIVNVENKGKSRSGDRITETALASIPGKVVEASLPRGVKSDNKGKKNPLRCRQAGAVPSSDLPDEKKVESSGSEGTSSVVSSAPGEQADAESASYGMRLRPMYRRKGKNGSHGWSTETATTIVAGKAADASPPEDVIKGLIEQSIETALASEAADASLARGFKPENKGKKESSGGRHTGMAPSTDCPDGMKPQPCPAAVGSDTQKSSGCQGTTWAAKTEGLQGKLTVVEVKAQPHLAAESGSYLKSSGDQGMIQVAESESSKEKQRVVDMRTTAQLKPWDMRNSGRQRPGGHSRVNIAPRQHDMVWVPKAASVADSAEVGKFP